VATDDPSDGTEGSGEDRLIARFFRPLVTAPGALALMGSGVRRSKLLMPGELLCAMPGVEVVEGLGVAR